MNNDISAKEEQFLKSLEGGLMTKDELIGFYKGNLFIATAQSDYKKVATYGKKLDMLTNGEDGINQAQNGVAPRVETQQASSNYVATDVSSITSDKNEQRAYQPKKIPVDNGNESDEALKNMENSAGNN